MAARGVNKVVYYLGSTTTLAHYANTKVLDGDPHKIEIADTTPDPGFDMSTASTYPANQGRPIRAGNVPTRIEWQEKAPVADVLTEHGMIVVPERFREIVEQFEPGVHQFLPVAYVDRRGKVLAQRYYFVACNRLDSIDREHSTMILFKERRWSTALAILGVDPTQIPLGFNINVEPKIVFNNAQVGGRHAWSDMFLPLVAPYLSDALAEALIEESFTGISISKGEAV
jgi:hypothetical protein